MFGFDVESYIATIAITFVLSVLKETCLPHVCCFFSCNKRVNTSLIGGIRDISSNWLCMCVKDSFNPMRNIVTY